MRQTRSIFSRKHIIVKELAYLETNLRVFIRIKRRNTGFCRAEMIFLPDVLLHTASNKNVIWHYNLRTVGY